VRNTALPANAETTTIMENLFKLVINKVKLVQCLFTTQNTITAVTVTFFSILISLYGYLKIVMADDSHLQY
jgi:hypothetical protein